eukprot:2929646-Rhodomonas_salina.1
MLPGDETAVLFVIDKAHKVCRRWVDPVGSGWRWWEEEEGGRAGLCQPFLAEQPGCASSDKAWGTQTETETREHRQRQRPERGLHTETGARENATKQPTSDGVGC